MKYLIFVSLIIIIILHFKEFLLPGNYNPAKLICTKDVIRNVDICKRVCPYGYFSLPGMDSCHPWLGCKDEVIIQSLLSASVVKTVYLAEWQGYKVVLSALSSKLFIEDFLHNLNRILTLSAHKEIVQMIGYCNYTLLTAYYELGSALNLHYHFQNSLRKYDNIKTRLKFCLSYASIIKFFHSNPNGSIVMCDSNNLAKTLSQYLITNDLDLVANDLDATPEVTPYKGIHCGHEELKGSFVAPEQNWPYSNETFNISKMPLYDEKTDIWKIPDVCNWFLNQVRDSDVVRYKLFTLHKQCKSANKLERPNADVIVKMYIKILNELANNESGDL